MSECVVRMEMPTSCEKCPACDYEEGNCLLADERNTLPHNGKRRSWCPIICQLPEGHGRLVDKDLLMQDLDFLNTFDTPDDGKELSYEDILVTIDDFPTIVPAERSDT